jgi:hypothetical protein
MRTTTIGIGIILLAGGIGSGCNGHSPTEVATKNGPTISNLSNPARATVLPLGLIEGQRPGVLPITFNFADPNADVNQVIFTTPGIGDPARNKLQGLTGLKSGSTGLQQDILLPASGTKVEFTVQVVDALGNSSNVLTGSFVSP